MFKKTGKHTKRLILITIALAGLFFIAWNIALVPTFQTWKQVKTMSIQSIALTDAPSKIAELKQRLQLFEQTIGKTSGEIRQEDIVKAISTYIQKNNQIELCKIPPVHRAEEHDYLANTYSLELQGNFVQLVRFLYQFEEQRILGKFSAVEFLKITDHRSKKNYLRLKIYIQTFRENKSEP